MQSVSSNVYRCKQCATKVRGREQLQPHLHWHYITDTNVDAYFSEVDETAHASETGPSPSEEPAVRRKSEPSYGVLVGSAAILALLGIAYYFSN